MAGALDDATAERRGAAEDAAAEDAAAGDSGIDEAFARFARSGDPQALALVFDRSAPRLILIAAHLVDTPADAEDVLQTTFFEAIRSAHRFTPGRPVLPWLIACVAETMCGPFKHRCSPIAKTCLPSFETVEPPGAPAGVEQPVIRSRQDPCKPELS